MSHNRIIASLGFSKPFFFHKVFWCQKASGDTLKALYKSIKGNLAGCCPQNTIVLYLLVMDRSKINNILGLDLKEKVSVSLHESFIASLSQPIFTYLHS